MGDTVVNVVACQDMAEHEDLKSLARSLRVLHDLCCQGQEGRRTTRAYLASWLAEENLGEDGAVFIQNRQIIDDAFSRALVGGAPLRVGGEDVTTVGMHVMYLLALCRLSL